MSRANVRLAVKNWFAGTAAIAPGNTPIAGLNKVYRAMPRVIDGADYFTGAGGDQHGAQAYVHIEHDIEHRTAHPRVTGKKDVFYDVALVIIFASTSADVTAGESDPGEAAMDAYDAVLELCRLRLRADPTLGGAVFSAGEGNELGIDDIDILSDLPRLDNQLWITWNAMRFKVKEKITA